MANPSSISSSLVPGSLPPGQPGIVYKLGSRCGDTIYIPCSRSAMRLLVTGKETQGEFAVVGTGGSAGEPIGFHFHREAHDIFLCLQGRMNVWAVDRARTMEPGDFASVPPTNVHQFQILDNNTEFVGLIVPGGWEEFFRFIGDPYTGPMWPEEDDRNPLEVLVPRLIAAQEKYDYVPVRDHPFVAPQPWDKATDSSLPEKHTPYFLKAGWAPRYQLGGVITSPLITTAESNGIFTVGMLEGSSYHDQPSFLQNLQFSQSHHCFLAVDGFFEFLIDGGVSPTLLGRLETLYIPKGCKFTLRFASRYAKAYVFSNGDGLTAALVRKGTPYHFSSIPEKGPAVDVVSLL
ncbi:hypothetical protein DTO212C5_2714 [Paecilomyces variotii]|nr:hypothetical protein DTO212C5_2714 [Paecilomyces variotii]